MAEELEAREALKHPDQPVADRSGIFYEKHFHDGQCAGRGCAAISAAAENALGRRPAVR
jgi:hypothetical protein